MSKNAIWAIIGGVVLIALFVILMGQGQSPVEEVKAGELPGQKILSATEKEICGITAPTTEGPYYISGMPELVRGNLNFTNLEGKSLEISGHVYEGLDEKKPVANAVIDIWQADSEGDYHPNGNGPASQYSPDQLGLRGTLTTDKNGYYKFSTIYPGEHTGRTRHINIKINKDGFEELTTQLMIESQAGDKTTFDEDTISQGLPNCHLLPLDDTQNPATAEFDFRLSK